MGLGALGARGSPQGGVGDKDTQVVGISPGSCSKHRSELPC